MPFKSSSSSSSLSAVETSVRGRNRPSSEAWTVETSLKLVRCGVDAERVSRFEKLVGQEKPWPLVFSAREAAHARKTKNPAEALCAAFCCKEAMFKALEKPFSFPACEFLSDPLTYAQERQERLSPRGARECSRQRSRRTQRRSRNGNGPQHIPSCSSSPLWCSISSSSSSTSAPEVAVKLSAKIRHRFGIRKAFVRILRPATGELAAVVHLFS